MKLVSEEEEFIKLPFESKTGNRFNFINEERSFHAKF
jgi:hypothetical protein